MRRYTSWILLFVGIGLVAVAEMATGVVYHDQNRNGVRDPGEPGIPNVAVSNGEAVVLTDGEGRYQLPVTDDTILFVIKPSGWMVPLDENQVPQFYYIHKPDGSPLNLFYSGVRPTGTLPDSVDFPLYPQREPNRFRVVLFGDTQPRNMEEIAYIAHDVVEELIGTDAVFGITLGDIVFDDLTLFEPLAEVTGQIGIPWFYVLGNHDRNTDAPDDTLSDETFERFFGPSYYAWNWGQAHFINLDDVYHYRDEEGKARYRGELGERQLRFVQNDLAQVDPDRLIVLVMHIPLWQIQDRKALLDLLEPFPNTLSISAHTHIQMDAFLGAEHGWDRQTPHHHHNHGTVSGSWWSGAPDELGIPHTMMADGGPNGYGYLTIEGNRYTLRYKAARRPADYQMDLWAPWEVVATEAPQTAVYANVFSGSTRTQVMMRVGTVGPWIPMELVQEPDPYFAQLKKLEKSENPPRGRRLPGLRPSPHLWKATLPEGLEPETYTIFVRAIDMFGQIDEGRRILRVR